MLCYKSLQKEIWCLALDTMKDGDCFFDTGLVIDNISHNLNDRRYIAKCISVIGNGHGDIYARISIGRAVYDLSISDKIISCLCLENSEDNSFKPKRIYHRDINVDFIGWLW